MRAILGAATQAGIHGEPVGTDSILGLTITIGAGIIRTHYLISFHITGAPKSDAGLAAAHLHFVFSLTHRINLSATTGRLTENQHKATSMPKNILFAMHIDNSKSYIIISVCYAGSLASAIPASAVN